MCSTTWCTACAAQRSEWVYREKRENRDLSGMMQLCGMERGQETLASEEGIEKAVRHGMIRCDLDRREEPSEHRVDPVVFDRLLYHSPL